MLYCLPHCWQQQSGICTSVHRLLVKHHKPHRLVMLDSVDINEIAKRDPTPEAVAGYVNGNFANYDAMVKRFPKAHHLGITVAGLTSSHARCVDVEPSDATNATALAWLKAHEHKRKPIVYTSLSNAQTLKNYLSSHGVARSKYLLWTAHYTFTKHICTSSCGFGFRGKADGTQWTNKSGGHNVDESVVSPHFF